MAIAEEPNADPEQPTFADATDLLARERSRKLRTLLAVGGAVVTTVVWVWWFESSRDQARDWGELEHGYAWGRGVAVFALGVVAAAVASAFPCRSWLRFFGAYATAMAFGLVMAVQAARLGQGNSGAASREELEVADLRRRQLLLREDYERYSAALAKHPPFSAPALQSAAAIEASIRRVDNLINIVDLMKQLTLDIESGQPAGAFPEAGEIRQLLDARKEDFELSRATLQSLSHHFGEWEYTEKGIVCDALALQRTLQTSVARAAGVVQRIKQLEARVDTSQWPGRLPQRPPGETTSKR